MQYNRNRRNKHRNSGLAANIKNTALRIWTSIVRVWGNIKAWFLELISDPKGRNMLIAAAGGLVVVIVVVVLLAAGVFSGGKPADGSTAQIGAPQSEAVSAEQAAAVVTMPVATPTPTEAPTPTPTPDPTLEYGMENEKVTELQNRLMDLGYLDIDEPTQYYGNATKTAVQHFQRQHGLDQDGIAGPKTLELIYSSEAKKYTLLEGMKGTDVDSFQRRLKELGYLNKVTGYYGTETVEAVKAFQERNKLTADGKAGEQTFALIYSPEAKESATKAKQERRRANINTMISVAEKQLGKKYVLGNEGPNSFDCSGLVYYCLKEAGSNRGRYNAAGYSKVSDWEKITSMDKMQKGDLIFFYNNAYSKVGHVGIYIGNGMMIDASSRNGKVVKRSCTTTYWKKHFVCARRPW